MIVLWDFGHVFWRNFYATRSNMDAYTLTIDKAREHCDAHDRVAICCDAPPLLRKQRYPEYKSNRDEKPVEALDSLRAAEEQIASWRVPVVRAEGHEADDVIATLVRQANEPVRIVSNDKDLYSLIGESVTMVRPDGIIVDGDACKMKFGVVPAQMPDYLALVGDTADNIPGCPGVGPGRARDLLVRFGAIDAVMAATDEELLAVRGVGKKTLDGLRSWDPALARELVMLRIDVPVDLEGLWRRSSAPPPVDEFAIQL